MGGSSCKQAPPWVARATIANANSPLLVLSQLRLENVIACIEKYRAQAQTAQALDVGLLEDLCDEFVSDCRHFARNDFRKQLVYLYTFTPSQPANISLPPSFRTSSTGLEVNALAPTVGPNSASPVVEVPPSASCVVTWKEDAPINDSVENRNALVRVDCLEVFASLIILASGPLEAKVEFLVKLFCWTEQQEVEAPAIYLLLVAAVRGVGLLTQNVPPSELLLAEVLERVDACAKCTESNLSFGFERVTKGKFIAASSLREKDRTSAADAEMTLPDNVQETLRKCASKMWHAPSVVTALAADEAVQEYHEVVTEIFLREQIEEKLSESLQNFRQTLQRVTDPAAAHATEKSVEESNHTACKRSLAAKRTPAFKKKSHIVDTVDFDLVPLPWKHVDAILHSCKLTRAFSTRLLDEVQYVSRTACQNLDIEWKKWLDEPTQEVLSDANLAELLPQFRKELEVSVEAQSPFDGPYQNFRRASSRRESAAVASKRKPPQLSSGASYADGLPGDPQTGGPPPRTTLSGKRMSAAEGVGTPHAGISTDAGNVGRHDANERTGKAEHSGFLSDSWKFSYSSGTYMWSDDLQLYVTPLLAFCAIDCHGDGAIAARHLDLLCHLLKAADPVRGGFFSKLEKVLASDTRALLALSAHSFDPFSQLRKILSRTRHEIKFLSFAVAIGICATIQDRRQHENTLASTFKRFDVEHSGSILRSDLEVLLIELIRNAVKIEDSSAAYDSALQSVVDKTINAFMQPGGDHVDFSVYQRAHDRIKKDAQKLKLEILELTTQFEASSSVARESSHLKHLNSQKTRRSSSVLRAGRSQSGLRRSSKLKSNSKNSLVESNLKNFLGKNRS